MLLSLGLSLQQQLWVGFESALVPPDYINILYKPFTTISARYCFGCFFYLRQHFVVFARVRGASFRLKSRGSRGSSFNPIWRFLSHCVEHFERPLHVMQLFVICVQLSINIKEKWATETQSTIIPEEICHFSNVLCDKVPLFILLSKSTVGKQRQRYGLLGQFIIIFFVNIYTNWSWICWINHMGIIRINPEESPAAACSCVFRMAHDFLVFFQHPIK